MRKTLIVCVLLLPFYGHALSETVSVDLRHRPPEISLSNDTFKGPIVDIITLLLSSQNIGPKWLNVPWPRTLVRAKYGEVDIVPRHSMTFERKSFLLPMLLGYEKRSVRYLFGPHVKDVSKYQSIEQLTNLRFGLLRGSYYGPYTEKIKTQKMTTNVNNIEQLMGLLLMGRIDVMPIQNLTWAEQAYNNIKSDFNNIQYQLAGFEESFIGGKYISIPKTSPLNVRFHALNCKLFQLRNSGEIDAIYNEYEIPPYFQIFDNIESKQQEESCNHK
jgi:polar amino acid transport system substrate-binding protein